MILTGRKIEEEVERGSIIIRPFQKENITTNSYDISLGNELLAYTSDVLDPYKKPEIKRIRIPESGYLLPKGSFHLGSTEQVIGSTEYVPLLHARSGTARSGLFVHVTADLVDIGFVGNLTLQLYATLPIRVYPGQKIGQVTFWRPYGEIRLYDGKYQNSCGPQASKTYLDYLEESSRAFCGSSDDVD